MKKIILSLVLTLMFVLSFNNVQAENINDDFTFTSKQSYTLYAIGINNKEHVYQFRNEVFGYSVKYKESEIPEFNASVSDIYTITTVNKFNKTIVTDIKLTELNEDTKKITSTYSSISMGTYSFDTYIMKLDSTDIVTPDGTKLFKFSSLYSDFKVNNFNYDITKFEKYNDYELIVGNEYLVTISQIEGRAVIVNVWPKY